MAGGNTVDDTSGATGASERKAEVTSVRQLYSGFFKLEEAVVRHSRFDGGEQTVSRLSLERGDSVAVVLVDARRRKVWLVEQFRYSSLAKGPGWLVEIPAGVIDEGETAEDCVRREAAEEIGFTIGAVELVATFYVSPGGTSERLFLFHAAVDGALRDQALAERTRDADEDIRLIERGLDDFLEDARGGRIDDAKTLIAGLWLSANRQRLGL